MSEPLPDDSKATPVKSGRAGQRRKVACVATLTAAGLSLGLIACGGGGDQAETTQTAAQVAGSTDTGSATETGGPSTQTQAGGPLSSGQS